MRIALFFFSLFYLLESCTFDNGVNLPGNSSDKKIRKQVIRIAVRHAKDQLGDTKKKVLENGSMVFTGSETEYLVDHASIVTGQIDEGASVDAIITLHIFRNLVLTAREHLILLNQGGKLMITRVLDGDMKFISIKDRIIFIETSTVDSDSPLYGCELCREIHKYQFTGGELIRIE